jgi:hypothetical protein
MKKPIHKIIGKTEHEYQMLLLQIMLDWSGLYAQGNDKKTQVLLSNRQINNWFRCEAAKLVREFRRVLIPFENERNITCKERCRLFVEIITKIYEIYPSSLLSEHKNILNESKHFNKN